MYKENSKLIYMLCSVAKDNKIICSESEEFCLWLCLIYSTCIVSSALSEIPEASK